MGGVEAEKNAEAAEGKRNSPTVAQKNAPAKNSPAQMGKAWGNAMMMGGTWMVMKNMMDKWRDAWKKMHERPKSMLDMFMDNWKKMFHLPDSPMSMWSKFLDNSKKLMGNMMSPVNVMAASRVMLSGVNRTMKAIANNTEKSVETAMSTGKMPSPVNLPAWIAVGAAQQK